MDNNTQENADADIDQPLLLQHPLGVLILTVFTDADCDRAWYF